MSAVLRRNEDTAYEDHRQRIDDADAEGYRIGKLGLGAGLGTGYYGDEAKAWMRGFQRGVAEFAKGGLARARRSCIDCSCGGLARCVGDAQ